MSEIKNGYVINKEYFFPAYSDGCCSHGSGGAFLRVMLDYEEAMIMGRYFRREDPTAMDFDINFGLKESLDSLLAEDIADSLRHDWELEKEERDEYEDEDWEEDEEEDEDWEEDEDADAYWIDEDDDEPDFDDQAWDLLGEMYFVWNEDLKADCIEFYKNHLRCPEARNIQYLD